jgi:two-component sensor histidine kinase
MTIVSLCNFDICIDPTLLNNPLPGKSACVTMFSIFFGYVDLGRPYLIFLGGILLCGIWLFIAFYKKCFKKKQRRLQISEAKTAFRIKQVEQISNDKENLSRVNERLEMEIQCRVRQNLDLMITLLNNHWGVLHDVAARKAIHQSQGRLKAMALTHQLIYKSDGEEYVEIAGFIKVLVGNLKIDLNVQTHLTIKYDLQLLNLKINRAEPLGLWLNEVITNCFRHAFSNQENGVIEIVLQRKSGGRVLICVRDNGRHNLSGFVFEEAQTLGIGLIRGLADQLEAQLSFSNDEGLIVGLDFWDQQDLK